MDDNITLEGEWNKLKNKLDTFEGEWEDLTQDEKKSPPARYFSSCFVKDNKIYLFGGKNNDIFRNDFYYYDPEVNIWSEIKTENTPTPRYGQIMWTHNNEIYLSSGINSNMQNLNDLHKLDRDMKKWVFINEARGDIPELRRGAGNYFLEETGMLYTFGGFNGVDRLEILHQFDLSSHFWKLLPNNKGISVRGRSYPSLVYYDKKLFLYGGRMTNPEYDENVYSYSFAESKWEKIQLKTKLIPPVRYAHLTIHPKGSNFFYVFGGGNTDTYSLGDIWRFDMKNLEWKMMCDDIEMYGRSCHSGCLLKNSIYVFGGCDVFYNEINDFMKFTLPSHHLRGQFTPDNYKLFPTVVKRNVFFCFLIRKHCLLKMLPRFVLYFVLGFLV